MTEWEQHQANVIKAGRFKVEQIDAQLNHQSQIIANARQRVALVGDIIDLEQKRIAVMQARLAYDEALWKFDVLKVERRRALLESNQAKRDAKAKLSRMQYISRVHEIPSCSAMVLNQVWFSIRLLIREAANYKEAYKHCRVLTKVSKAKRPKYRRDERVIKLVNELKDIVNRNVGT